MAYSYTHTQGISSDLWNITHNLGTNAPIVSVSVYVNNVLSAIIPSTIRVINQNSVEIGFSIPYSGVARII